MPATSATTDRERILRVVVGTAGHIDHGKSSLVRRLTGIDPDRLPEEKARGLTIDLGFANLQLSDGSRIGIIDVPGHEKFVHNMVAGATGIDLALLVVAADDGVMPQTLEHLEILELLGIRRGIIAITKIDMVSPELRELVIEDVRTTVGGTFLQQAPVVSVSSATGEGIELLKKLLEKTAREIPPRKIGGIFRLPIQRVFAAKGFGCVLAGVPLSGSLTIGDPVEVRPGDHKGSIRGLEAYHRTVDRITAGHSSALNVSGIEASQCRRGMAAVTPGYYPPTEFVTVKLKHLLRRKRPIRDRDILRFHAGTNESGAIVRLLDRDQLLPGDEVFVQLQLEEPAVVGVGDRFLVRSPSPPATVGGGIVVDVRSEKLKKRKPQVMADLDAALASIGDPRAQLLLELARCEFAPSKAPSLARAIATTDSECAEWIEACIAVGECVRLKNATIILKKNLDRARVLVESKISAFFKENAARLVCDRLYINEQTGLDSHLLDEALGELAAKRVFELEPGGGVRSIQKQPAALGADQTKLREEVLAILQKGRFQPPSIDDLAAAVTKPRSQLDIILKRLVEEKLAARISPEFHFSMAAVDEAKAAIARNCAKHTSRGGDGELDLPSLRDELGTTRRWLIPLMEWMDSTGFTTRLGARRILKKRN
ncbi:MAG: selenocysteine-specific translation elongation factor [Planctomycetes bacterium]|nr:selenocysteine-specific translation elongation factor [Planctomycetota bacterium]